MKKVLIGFLLFVAFFIIYFLQSNFFNWFTIGGIKPNLFVILALFVGLFAGRIRGILFGAIFGILLDFFIGRNIRSYSYSIGYNRIYRWIFR